jgi:hypothetical protein
LLRGCQSPVEVIPLAFVPPANFQHGAANGLWRRVFHPRLMRSIRSGLTWQQAGEDLKRAAIAAFQEMETRSV